MYILDVDVDVDVCIGQACHLSLMFPKLYW